MNLLQRATPNRTVATTLLGLAMAFNVACDRQPSDGTPPASETTAAAASDTASKTLPPVLLADVRKIIADAAANDQILVLDFWATWCIPCVQMFPELHEKLPQISKKVKVVTITLDSPGKYEALAVDFLRKHDAMKDAYRIGGEAEQWDELVAGLGKKWQDLNVPAILVYNQKGELWDEFVDERAKATLILERVRELASTSAQ